MEIISRVRSRIQQSIRTEKMSVAGVWTACLLGLLLLLGGAGHTYTCVVLPMLLSANCRHPLACLRGLAGSLSPALSVLHRLYTPIAHTEEAFMRMGNICTMINQLVFFAVCDRVLLSPVRSSAACAHALLTYTVTAYLVSYVRECALLQARWSPFVPLTQHSSLRHVAVSATKLVLEWTKAVTFVVTCVTLTAAFAVVPQCRPQPCYTFLTAFYYTLTERGLVADRLPAMLAYLRLQLLDSLEVLWAPVIVNAVALSMSALLILAMTLLLLNNSNHHYNHHYHHHHERWSSYLLLALALYVNVYLPWKALSSTCLATLREERAALSRYRHATHTELAAFDDVCAVCLCPMVSARVTPCQHIFHADCLRQCLRGSDMCPVCKRKLLFS